ncbi:RING-box protein 2 isoform X2 [Gallus gallus]|uniref:RING-box protein 2 isoform X2 n=1 Tax=Gallus gallus TaxID=9031 RepID=UPI001EFF6F44|nr:RING-box protein 2 isoform X2 [Gallus gallus]XP_046779736.1 RING-box protein 2 isoform X2 [Gallus gallus]
MADVEDGDELGAPHSHPGSSASKAGGPDKMFSLKKWNAVAMWSWDVECDTCAICRVQVMGKRLPAGPGPPWPPSPPLGGGCPPGQPALPRGCPPSGDAASGPVWPCPSFTLPRPPGSEGRSRFLRRPSLRRPREGSGRGARSPHRGLSRPMPALDVKLKTNKRIVLWFGENAIIPSTIAACRCG